MSAVRTILVQPHNLELLAELDGRGLMPADVVMPTWPLPQSGSTLRAASRDMTDHVAFRTVAARGVNALKQVEAYRREFACGGTSYPFLIGDDEDLSRLLDSLAPPTDNGRAALELARALDPGDWLEQRSRKAKPRWPKDGPGRLKMVRSQYNSANQTLKPLMFIGLVELQHPWELFARIGYGNWNDCPSPSVHTALHRHWHERFGVEPIAVCNDVVECTLARPPQERSAALALAREHEAYCPDVIEQGMGSIGNLASTLLSADHWYFWWD